ncbi:FAD-binding oxidoreductase [Halopiger xanaduensis]|uniref:(R)-6-hydroxynicotine oxidase n=1 Tax=Halopiger xanaduensis (strain DSM 18323 / JCM 14033 / SH-6) TaxID=797210 RepID=F8D9K9_HALXS|nr:FAD-binding oxidoreductase [Halopiger xanaduensis]AEH38097.1 (R)-6-hydroxynicotine oxidase [Halopiger xanaduensis SH-6]
MGTIDILPGEEALANVPGSAVRSFETEFAGDVIRPADPAYDDARRVWNGMIDAYPAIVARCTGVADVVAAVTFAREQELPLTVRGGGHNVAGTAVRDGALVVDLEPMSGVRVDPDERTVRVEGGATLGDADRETQLFGLATPLGAVSQTGVAGLTLNGGYGHLSREYGLSLDNLRSVDVVTADGQVRTASADRHTDLFWGVRGSGGALGVVTSFEFDCYEVGPEVSVLFPWFHADDTEAVFERYLEWTADAPREAGVLAFTAHVPPLEEFPEERRGEPAVAMLGAYRGDPEDAEGVFEPLLTAATPIVDFSGPMPFVDLQSMLDEDYPDGLRYYWKSIYLEAVTDEVRDLMVRYNEAAPSPLSTVDLWHLDGAVAEVPRDATAFWHRDEPFMLTVEANWEEPADDDANVAWARDAIADVRALSVATGRYGNFPGLNEEDDPARATFGDNYERLVDVKTEYDPEDLFGTEASVPPRAG